MDICGACLSAERDLTPVESIFHYINNIWKNLPLQISHSVCWECKAVFMKMWKFKEQVMLAQSVLQNAIPSMTDNTLTNLSFTFKSNFDYVYEDEEIKKEIPDAISSEVKIIYTEDVNECFDTACKSSDIKTEDLNTQMDGDDLKNDDEIGSTWEEGTGATYFDDTNIDSKQEDEMQFTEKERRFNIQFMSEEDMLEARNNDRHAKRYVKSPYKCEKCIVGYFIKEHYDRHMKDLHNDVSNSFTCHICQINMGDSDYHRYHVKRHYVKYSCKICRYENHKLNTMQAHHNKIHESERRFSCKICGEQFSVQGKLRYHIETRHRAPPQCHICDKKLSNKTALKTHMQSHMGRRHKCTICNKLYKGAAGLRSHMRCHEEPSEGSYCAECDIQFKSIYRYRTHLRVSSKHLTVDNIRYECSDCGKRFAVKTNLRRHIRSVHMKLYQFYCQICSKGFMRKGRLKGHIATAHENIPNPRNYICSYCDKGFTALNVLKNHVRTHTGEKPYTCGLCEMRFAQRTTLTTHVRGVHQTVKKNR